MKRFLVLLLVAIPLASFADERILDYHSDIRIFVDGWIEVTETIRVRAEGRNITRGIYRDFPTRYRDRWGNSVVVKFEPLAVLRNGKPEAFHTESMSNGVRTYFGSADRLIDSGEHEYTFRYRAGRMLGFFDEHDELYWNVTGNGWAFSIDSASAAITADFPLRGGFTNTVAFTGPAGHDGDDYEARIATDGVAHFNTTRALPPTHGLAITVTWPKGIVDEPTSMERAGWLLADNSNLLVALGGLIGLFAWYLPVWKRYGRDPEAGVTFPRYEPPAGFSPASLRYIREMSYDNQVMTAAVVNLAVKGYLRIVKQHKDHWLERTDPGEGAAAMAAGERELHDALFRDGDRIELDSENHRTIGAAQAAHQKSLKQDYAQRYFETNGKLSIPAIIIALVSGVIALKIGDGPGFAVIATVVAMVITIIVFAILMMRPTQLGRALLDEVDGFGEYLEIAEKDEMNLRNPPEKTPELFERYLPYALAIGVEQAWAERFSKILAAIQAPDGGTYRPAWYSGSWNSHSLVQTTSSLSSGLGSAISSSASAPGSSSGVSGSSGGGGGGGGGGGW